MIKTTIEWHDGKKELPEKSGEYLVKCACLYFVMGFSSKHNKFNCRDDATGEEAAATEMFPKYWAELPSLPESEVASNG